MAAGGPVGRAPNEKASRIAPGGPLTVAGSGKAYSAAAFLAAAPNLAFSSPDT